MEFSPDGIFVACAGRFVYVNPALISLLGGAGPSDFLGRLVFDFVHPDYHDLVRQRVRDLKAGVGRAFVDEKYIRLDGGIVDVSVGARETSYRGLSANQVILRDISERKRRERELQEARDWAQDASRAKSEFLANMSHELRTPMNSILGSCEMLLERDLPAEQRAQVARMARAGEGLLRIINAVLDMSRIEAGRMALERGCFSLRDLIGLSYDLLQVSASEKGLAFSRWVAPDLPDYYEGDALRVQQILNNLLGNAVKFTSQGSVNLSVSIAPEAQAAPRTGSAPFPAGTVVPLLFVVQDSGPGIEPDRVAAIFDAFTQADSSVSRRFGGTGLGLHLSQELARMMGGEISVSSRAGSGSTFRLRLPLRVLEAPERVPAQAPASEVPEMVGAAPLRILVAEDNDDNRALIRGLLEPLPVELRFAVDGDDAVRRALAGGFDLIFMDIQMPGRDGYAATQAIRAFEAREERPRTPIVALTAYAFQEDVARCLAAGCDDHLAKPFKKKQLIEMIARYARLREKV